MQTMPRFFRALQAKAKKNTGGCVVKPITILRGTFVDIVLCGFGCGYGFGYGGYGSGYGFGFGSGNGFGRETNNGFEECS